MKQAETFLKKLTLKEKDTVVVAVSGGPDSMALLHLLYQFRQTHPFTLVCAHVNHSKRKESEEEAIFVKNYCEERHILFEYLKVENWGNKNFHDEAHRRRYEFFEKVIKKYHASYLFTAHHGDDLMETILMRITRGSTMYGYRAFRPIEKRKDYTLVRPFLYQSKEDLLKYVHHYHIPYVIDESNTKDTYTRNRYRKVILPFLKKENPNVIEKFNEFSSLLDEYEQYVQKQVQEKYDTIVNDHSIYVSEYQKQDSLIRKKILEQWLLNLYQDDIVQLTKRHIEELDYLLCSKKAIVSKL